jgi:DNA helicase-2/ATP-dependent DNA helicase PcrA
LMGKVQVYELPSSAAQRHGIDLRWLRRTSLQLVMRLPRSCPDSVEGCNQWLDTLRTEIKRLELDYPPRVSEKTFFPQPRTPGWHEHLSRSDSATLRCSTIHEAKGRQYEAVCVVIPPDTAGFNRTSELFQVWEARIDNEGKRVIYVGVTRARKLVALALPNSFRERLTSILKNAHVSYALHSIQ